jgi:SH3 domain protein
MLVTACFSTFAQTNAYVTDELRVNLRSGAGNGYRIQERIKSGTPLTVLNERSGWTRVRTQGGSTGWVPSQFVVADAPASARLPDIEADLEDARERVLSLETELQRVRGERDAAHERLIELEEERDKLASQVEEASKGLELAKENQRLKKEAVDLKRRVQDLENEVSRLSGHNRQEWFLVGAGVLGFGLVVGLLLGRIKTPKRGNWNQL